MTDRSMLLLADHTSANEIACLHFHCASGFYTQILAYMLDSLVRVSRRVGENHFSRIAKAQKVDSTSKPLRVKQCIAFQPPHGPGYRHLAKGRALPSIEASIQHACTLPRAVTVFKLAPSNLSSLSGSATRRIDPGTRTQSETVGNSC
jgi:hypothetical protein